MNDKFLTINEVAALLKVHRNSVSAWLKEGLFPNTLRIRGVIRIPMSDIEAFKEAV